VAETTAPVLRLSRTIKASRQRVFEAWTKPDLIAKWFRPTEEIRVVIARADPKQGGEYRIGFQSPDSDQVNIVSGTYVEFDPPNRFVMTWAWQAPNDSFEESYLGQVSKVTIELSETTDGRTELTLTHEGLPTTDICEHHAWGWNGALDFLVGLF